MQIIGLTVTRNGKETEEFFLKCDEHNWYYNGRPPLTTGCKDCWLVFYYGQLAQSGADKKELVDQLESAIRHAAELEDKGLFDFKPDFKVHIDKDVN